ncbi:hypothetical protein [Microcoleus sp. CAWBG58]|uniref:hypothetical protein n=1 Tax=Microcoleus sp. CAWBG58 TaxID=2841651 RepID=UPI0025E384E5|nr:hypothetical protein [Microcoleus sp. CAWBG58]
MTNFNPLDFDGMLDRVAAGEEDLPDSLVVAIVDTDNSIKSRIIRQRASLSHLRHLLSHVNWSQKIAICQLACNQIDQRERLVQVLPVGGEFDTKIKAAIALMAELTPDILSEIVIEIMESYQNNR